MQPNGHCHYCFGNLPPDDKKAIPTYRDRLFCSEKCDRAWQMLNAQTTARFILPKQPSP